MLDGLYAGATGMVAQQNRMDNIANDLANVNTNGYKRQRIGFQDLLYESIGRAKAVNPDDRFGNGVRSGALDRTMSQGAFNRTDNPLDLAIEGNGFFTVRNREGGLALTRDGSFSADARGRLVTASGGLVQPQITLPRGADPAKISVAGNGRITLDGQLLGQLQIVTVASPQQLQAIGANQFAPTPQSGQPVAANNFQVQQGVLEGSNVDVSQALADLIEAQRAYELNSRMIRTADEMLSMANQIRR